MGDNADKHSKATCRMATPAASQRAFNRTVCQALADLHSKMASDAKSNHASHLGEFRGSVLKASHRKAESGVLPSLPEVLSAFVAV